MVEAVSTLRRRLAEQVVLRFAVSGAVDAGTLVADERLERDMAVYAAEHTNAALLDLRQRRPATVVRPATARQAVRQWNARNPGRTIGALARALVTGSKDVHPAALREFELLVLRQNAILTEAAVYAGASDPEAAHLHLLEPENDLDVEIADVSELLRGASRLTGLDPQYRAARALREDVARYDAELNAIHDLYPTFDGKADELVNLAAQRFGAAYTARLVFVAMPGMRMNQRMVQLIDRVGAVLDLDRLLTQEARTPEPPTAYARPKLAEIDAHVARFGCAPEGEEAWLRRNRMVLTAQEMLRADAEIIRLYATTEKAEPRFRYGTFRKPDLRLAEFARARERDVARDVTRRRDMGLQGYTCAVGLPAAVNMPHAEPRSPSARRTGHEVFPALTLPGLS